MHNVRLQCQYVERKCLMLIRIFELTLFWADKGEILPRTRDNIIHDIQNFVVAEIDGEVVGTASLYIYQTKLAEIRSSCD